MQIRQAKQEDYSKIYPMIKDAFEGAEHSDGCEQDLVHRLQESSSFIPELSLVAVIDDLIVGYILFTKIALGKSVELALAPLAVASEYQNKGIGSALIKEGHKRAEELGYAFCVVLGSEKYYPRFGYKRASLFGILAPFDVPDENFMALSFNNEEKKFNEKVQYDKAFLL